MRERRQTEVSSVLKIVTLIASNLSQGIFVGFPFATGVLFLEWCDVFYDTSRTRIAWVIALHSGFPLAFGPLASVLIKKIGFRPCYILGVFMASGGLVMAAFSNGTVLLLIFFGICAGIGNCLVYIPSVVVVNLIFKKRKLLANSVSVSGISIGIMSGSVLFEFLLDRYGWAGCLLIHAGVTLQGLWLSFALQFPEKEKKAVEEKEEGKVVVTKLSKQRAHRKLFMNVNFILLLVGDMLWNFGSAIFLTTIAEVSKLAYHSHRRSAYLVSLVGAANLIGRLSTGLMAFQKQMSNLHLLAMTTTGTVIPMVLVPVLQDYYFALVALATLYGFAFGSQVSLLAPVTVHILSVDLLVYGYGWVMLADGVGIACGPPVAGSVFDLYGSFDAAYYMSGAASLIAVILQLVINCNLKPSNEI